MSPRTPTTEGASDDIGLYTPPGNDDDDQYEKLILCAFGKWYGDNGNFEQLARQEATGDGQEKPTINDITNKKMEDIFSEEWIEVFLDRSRGGMEGWREREVLDELEKPPFLNGETLISITESYIRDSTESESTKTKLVTGLVEYVIQAIEDVEEDPVEEILEKIQDELYNRIDDEIKENESNEDVSYWYDHKDKLLDKCKTEIDGFTAELVRNNCNSSLFQVGQDTRTPPTE